MKATFLLLFLSSILKLNAQSTWIERISYNASSAGMYIYHDSVCGIQNVTVGADGNLYMLGKVQMDNSEKIIKISQSGGHFLWTADVGYHASLSYTQGIMLRATSDSGCVLLVNNAGWINTYHINASIKKYSASGVLQWTRNFSSSPVYDNGGYDIIQNASGNYYVLFADSLAELNSSGVVIFKTNAVKGKQLFQLSGGNLLVRKDNSIVRTDLSGNVSWTYSPISTSDVVSFSNSAGYICGQGTQIIKIDATTGSMVWSKSISLNHISGIDATADGGAIISIGYPVINAYGIQENAIPGKLKKYDSNGNVEWTKTYYFPYYGLTCVKQLPSGKYIVGGTFTARDILRGGEKDYSGFAALVDSAGNGNLKTASYLWPGDADMNDTLAFATDALMVGIAWGATGKARDHQNFVPHIQYYSEYYSDYASDWSQTFGNGLNYKSADFNGDGVINSTDLAYPIGFGSSIPLGNPPLNSIPYFSLVPENSNVNPGDTMRFYMIAGSAAAQVDSVYDLAAQLYLETYFNGTELLDETYSKISAFSSDFGIPGVNAIMSANSEYIFYGYASILFSRTDHHNVMHLHDTLGVIELRANPDINSPVVFTISITGFGAATYDAAHVPFNTINASVTIGGCFSPTVSISAGGPATVCKPDGVALNSSTTGNVTSYQWRKGNTNQSGATSSSFTATKSGTYSVVVTNTCGTATSNSISVTMNSKPAATVSPGGTVNMCSGQTTLLTANSGNNLTYQWKKGGTNISGATNQTYNASTAGKFKVIVTNVAGCTKASPVTTINITCKEESEIGGYGFMVFPNPSSDQFVIQFGDDREYAIRITDLLGRTVDEFPRVKTELVFGKEFHDGIYFVEVKDGSETMVRKIVKE